MSATALPSGVHLPSSARAPGKCIVFGEHSVVHGGPELLFAIDLYTQVVVRAAAHTTLNADPGARTTNPYFRETLATLWAEGPTVDVRSVSRLPRAAGLGSSAAFLAALVTALSPDEQATDLPHLAQRCFELERAAQGVGSPGDTSASVAGGYLTVNSAAGARLWTVDAEAQHWQVRRLADPGWIWVVGYSGVPRSTAEAVHAVGRRLSAPDGPELLTRFATVAREGIAALEQGDRAAVAEALGANQGLLREVGVSHPRLEALLDAVAPAAQGAKLTGAGCGGSVLVLPVPGKEPEAMRRLARAGGVPFAVRPSPTGVEPIVPP